MRISDWSSDVCSSDLPDRDARPAGIRAASPADVEGAGADASFRRARSAFARPYAHDRRGAAMSAFGMVLMRRAKVLAREASDRMAEAMTAAAEAELPNGVEIGRGETGVALSGRRLRVRYWVTAGRAPDARLRLAFERLREGGRR